MRIKIIGFRVGVSRPTANRTFTPDVGEGEFSEDNRVLINVEDLGHLVAEVLSKSDFISIRRVND